MEKIKSKLAIVIPYYKINFFKEVLDSLKNQTNKNFNVYIGNDCGEVCPLELVNTYIGEFNFLYQTFDQNLGGKDLAGQWDRCLQLIKEEPWFILLGDDDYLSNNYVEEVLKAISYIEESNSEINIIKTKTIIVNGSGEQIQSLYEDRPSVIKNSIDFFLDKFNYGYNSSLTEHVFRTSAYLHSGFVKYPLGWFADDMSILKIADGKDMLYINSCTCYFRVSSFNISGGKGDIKLKQLASNLFLKDVESYIDYDLLNEGQKRLYIRFLEDFKVRNKEYLNEFCYLNNYVVAFGLLNGVYKYFKIQLVIFLVRNNFK